MQRITGDDSFGLPYWEWEQNDRSPFTEEYYGIPSNVYGPAENVTGDLINPEDWHVVCDLVYRDPDVDCADSWKLCNPEIDLAARRPLQRGGSSTYVPNIVEVMIALAAPLYDAKDKDGKYSLLSPRESFRSRLEGWNSICSAVICIGPRGILRMHNNIHNWVAGHLSFVPSAINDPVFNVHHANVDRILESWLKRFTDVIPPYVPVMGGHPGHNRGDFLVPLFPLMTALEHYKVAEDLGYMYQSLISAEIPDDDIEDCDDVDIICPTCDANGTCVDCTDDQTCPEPGAVVIIIPTRPDKDNEDDSGTVELGLGLGLGVPLLITIVIIAILLIILYNHRRSPEYQAVLSKKGEEG